MTRHVTGNFPRRRVCAARRWKSRETIVVHDVRKDVRYLPTFGTTLSEIVVPILSKTERVVGVIAAESEKLKAFSSEDRGSARARGDVDGARFQMNPATGDGSRRDFSMAERGDLLPRRIGQILISRRRQGLNCGIGTTKAARIFPIRRMQLRRWKSRASMTKGSIAR